MAASASVTRTSDTYINALLGDYKWASGNLSYSFPTASSQYASGYGSNEPLNNFEALNATQQGVARAAFANFAAVANVTFTELTGSDAANATLRLAESDAPSTAWAYMPHTAAEGGDTWFNNSNGYYDNPRQGNYAYTTFLHEMGHTLGLEHPHDNGMPVDGDSMEYSVMSYRAYVGAPLTGYPNETWGFAQSLMMYDIAAVQHLYGANFSTNSGNTTYSWSPTTGEMSINGVGQGAPGGNRIFQTVWDGGGADTYDFSNYATDLSIDLRPGGWSTLSTTQLARLHYNGSEIAEGNVANALQHNGDVRSLIENAVGGSGDDTIVGNAAANTLWGGSGNDTLSGAAGSDIMVGGAGSDTYYVDDAGDKLVEENVAGVDHVFSSVSFALRQHNQYLENLTLTGQDNIAGTGNGLSNVITGNSGNNLLNGAWGNDLLIGGEGDDTFRDDHGADRMVGGAGSDTYYVDDAGDKLVEENVAGVDQVFSSVSFALRQHNQYLENLTLTGQDNIAGTGNGLSNVITGNSGNNLLNGAWGNDLLIGGEGDDTFRDDHGADRMVGGAGSDTYYVDDAGDKVVEENVAGVDQVFSSVSFALRQHNQYLENLTLTGQDNIAGTGNGLSNVITGNSGNNFLNGAWGNDLLIGGDGDDTFWDDHGADRMVGGAGADVFAFQNESQSLPSARDQIDDFVSGEDRIDLRGIDADRGASGDQAFSFIGSSAFSGKAGELNCIDGILSGHTDADGIVDFQVCFLNAPLIVGSDFYL